MSVTYLAEAGAGGGLAGAVADFATAVMGALGSPGAGLANMLDGIIPVLPSEVILPLAGFAAQRGELNLYAALVWTTIGSLAGAVIMYYAGALLGRDRVRALAAKIPLVRASEIDRAESWFTRHGQKTVLLARMVPVFRSVISIPAGVERMPLARFLVLTGIGSAVWNTVFVLAGYLLGDNWSLVERYGGYLSKAVIALCVLAVAYFVVSRLLRRRRDRLTDRQPAGESPAGPPPAPTGRVYYSSNYTGQPDRHDLPPGR
jgi:membrane protein DedA with SNARE-associated domain